MGRGGRLPRFTSGVARRPRDRGLKAIEIPGFGRSIRRGEETPPPLLGCKKEKMASMILPQVHLRKPCYDFSFL